MKTTLLALLILTLPLPCYGQFGISNQSKVSVHLELAQTQEDSTYTKRLLMHSQAAVSSLHRAVIAKDMQQSELAFVLDVKGIKANRHLTGYAVSVTALENDKSTQYYKWIDTHILASGINRPDAVADDVAVWVYDVIKTR